MNTLTTNSTGKWEIAKQFDFDYGHRVYNQVLDKEFSIDDCLCCRRLHGHHGKVMVFLEGDKLTRGMLVDFKFLNYLKKFIDEVIDHKFIIGKEDPNFDQILTKTTAWPEVSEKFEGDRWPLVSVPIGELTGDWTTQLQYQIVAPALQKVVPTTTWEHLESFVVVDFVPTSENLSRWIQQIAQEKMSKLGIKVSKVQFYETPKSQSVYIA